MSYMTSVCREAREVALIGVIQKLAPLVQNKTLSLETASDVVCKTKEEFVFVAKEFGYDLSEYLNGK